LGIYLAATMLIINWYPYHGSKKQKFYICFFGPSPLPFTNG
jgi:hypothetical protein